ncbi:ABC-2 type transport system permease protein [Virgibacillus natechei]|uniref:ABC-2 type transport system permease protein n=1 Tax=Virgibacillus natechei TaxID=1216297 RepID=A0ABS4IFS8_9BACI|nr:ABC transporter permease [Virgibacillus natechei]MBP1969799.1 ABC-2 type transport system permease protein [Virgibacillus natechei]UZD12665.1 ABC transporter permease [Virgibacillus natechei]
MHIRRISAIFEKDIKDFMKNMMLLMMPVIPIVLALLYTRIGGGNEEIPIFLIYVIVGTTYSAVTSSTIMTMMAEENEKKTLRGLIQSPASMMDIIIGKSLVTGLITFISLIVSLVIIDIEPFLNFRVILGLLLLFLFFLLLGIGIGLFTKSIAATSVYLMPVMFLFGFTPMIGMLGLDEESIAIQIFDTFPIMQGIEIHDTTSWLPLGIIAIWVVAAAVFMYVCFRKTMTDD